MDGWMRMDVRMGLSLGDWVSLIENVMWNRAPKEKREPEVCP